MTVLKSTIWNGTAVSIRLATGLALNKILAILVGPSGYAIIGQLQNAMQILLTFSAGAINNGVTRYTVDYREDPKRQALLWSTATRMVIVCSLVTGAVIALFHRSLATHFLGSEDYSTIFLWFGASILFFTLNVMLLAILNGQKDLRTYVTSNIAGSAVILLVMAGLTWLFGLYGALLAMVINQAIVFFVTLFLCRRKPWFRRANMFGPFSRPMAIALLSFAVMAAVSAISNNVGQVVVRQIVADRFGLDYAGYWDGMIRISQLNMLLVASSMSFYFLPRMAELDGWDEIRREIWAGGKLVLPIFVGGAVAAYLLRDVVVMLLFTRDFAPMEQLFGWQLAGDTVRVASWFLAYVMIGKAMIRAYVLTEILTNAVFVLLSWGLIDRMGFEGVAAAHLITYALAFLAMFVAVSRSPRLLKGGEPGRGAGPQP